MRPEPGDLAHCVVPPGYQRTFHMRFCMIRVDGFDDLSPNFRPVDAVQDLLFCEWCSPVLVKGRNVRGCWMVAGWLRKVSGPGVDAGADQVLDELLPPLVIPEVDCA